MSQKLILLISLLIAFPLFADDGSGILAKRGEGIVTHGELDAWMTRIPEGDRAEFLRDGKRLEQVLAQLLTFDQLAHDAKQAGFDQDEMVISRMRLAANEELATAWSEHVIATAASPDYDQMAYEAYLLNPGEFMTNRSIDVTHLLISTETRTEEEALEMVTGFREALEKDPSVFEGLIVQYSEDPSMATNRGKFERVEQGDMVKPFEDRAFALQLGEISEPVKTNYGFHIIRLDGVHKSELKPFESVKAGLIRKEQSIHEKRVRLDYLNQLGSLPTEIPQEELKKMLSRYFEPEALATPVVDDSE